MGQFGKYSLIPKLDCIANYLSANAASELRRKGQFRNYAYSKTGCITNYMSANTASKLQHCATLCSPRTVKQRAVLISFESRVIVNWDSNDTAAVTLRVLAVKLGQICMGQGVLCICTFG